MKKILRLFIFTILMISFTYPVNASTITYERNEANNYGVNKKWYVGAANKYNVENTPLVDASEKIYDFADILTDEEENEILIDVKNFIETTNMDMVILTVNMPYSYDDKNHEYATDFYDYNDFGIDFEKYSGVLLLRNSWESDPYYNVYMFGNSQLYYNFDRSEAMLDSIYYDFRSHNYLSGYKEFISSYLNYYEAGIPSEYKNYYVDDMGFLKQKYTPPIFIALFISLAVSGITIAIMISKNKMVKKQTTAKEYLNSSSIKYNTRNNTLVNSYTRSYTVSSSSSGGRSGGGSFRGSSGGGHSRGGGRHG